VFVTGEEMGLLGSDYFAHYPTVPLKTIVANVNIDGAPGSYFGMKDVVALGAEHSTMGDEVAAAAKEMGYEVSPDPMPEEVSFIRSDQYSFVLQGVPAVDVEDGVHATDPKVNGLDVIKKWLVTRYHTPLDNMDQPIDFDSAAKGAVMNSWSDIRSRSTKPPRNGTRAISSEQHLGQDTPPPAPESEGSV
jgi:Zn-dependent M28 family amino/carboxypeptidase